MFGGHQPVFSSASGDVVIYLLLVVMANCKSLSWIFILSLGYYYFSTLFLTCQPYQFDVTYAMTISRVRNRLLNTPSPKSLFHTLSDSFIKKWVWKGENIEKKTSNPCVWFNLSTDLWGNHLFSAFRATLRTSNTPITNQMKKSPANHKTCHFSQVSKSGSSLETAWK